MMAAQRLKERNDLYLEKLKMKREAKLGQADIIKKL
jgi:hypothetical protein